MLEVAGRWTVTEGGLVPLADTYTIGSEVVVPTEPGEFEPKANKPAGLSTVNPASLNNYAQHGPDLYVLKTPWSTIEPSQGNYNWAFIDNALAAYPTRKMTLRIQAGGDMPGWLKTASGGAIDLYNVSRDMWVNCGRWWTQIAMDSWQAMITAAGNRYDGDPRVVLVSADLPMVVYSEPFILGSHNPSGIALFNAGCNLTTQTHSIKRCVADTCTAFPTTRVELAITSRLQYPVATGVAFSWPLGRQIALDLALAHRHQVIFTDYGLGVDDTLAAHTPTGTLTTESDVYAWMLLRSQAALEDGGGPVGYQLTPRGQTQPADYVAMATNALDLGGWFVETSGWGSMGSADITARDSALKAQAAAGA